MIPVKANEEIIGLLQLNHKEENKFTLHLIESLEEVCEYIGVALMKCKAEEQSRQKIQLQALIEMAGATCHEINQPLQAILGNSELFLDNIVARNNETVEKIMGEINKSAQRIRTLTMKMQNITNYNTIQYIGDCSIIDFNSMENTR